MNIHIPGPTPKFNQIQFRRSIEEEVERLIAVLDALDGDPDLEPGNDDEPSLGWTNARGGWSHRDDGDEREEDGADWEDGADLEPTLGAPEKHPSPFHESPYLQWCRSQEHWSDGARGDHEREDENEHGGDILDEPHDCGGDSEPSLGWPECRAGRGAVGLAGTIEEDRELDGGCWS